MNLTLIASITSALKTALSTQKVYLLHVPEREFVLNELTIVLNVNNTANENTMDFKESNRVYTVDITMNHKSVAEFEQLSIYARKAMYALEGTEGINYVSLSGDNLDYDDDLEIYQYTLTFQVN